MEYEINNDTQIIIKENNVTKIIESEETLYNNKEPINIIKHSCEYFGSSLEGRHEGTKKLLGITHKSPIIIEESNRIIFFPTTSPDNNDCSWINLSKVDKLLKLSNNRSKIVFKNGYVCEFNVSYGSLSNQILRATRLKYVLEERLIKKEDNII